MRFVTTIGLIALCSSFVAIASDESGGCLDAVADLEGKTVLGVVGFSGAPKPDQWLILTRKDSGELRELAWSMGGVVHERVINPLPGQDLPDIPINFESVQLDSGQAFVIASALAEKQGISFATAHFHLRCRDAGEEPVWLLKLLGKAQDSRGVVYLSAVTGEVLRSAWTVREIEEFAAVSPIFTRRGQ